MLENIKVFEIGTEAAPKYAERYLDSFINSQYWTEASIHHHQKLIQDSSGPSERQLLRAVAISLPSALISDALAKHFAGATSPAMYQLLVDIATELNVQTYLAPEQCGTTIAHLAPDLLLYTPGGEPIFTGTLPELALVPCYT